MNKFKVGDKVKRTSHYWMGMKVGDVSTVSGIANGLNITLTDFVGFHGVNSFELVEDEKPMKNEFDIKSEKWFIRTPTPEISEAVQLWLFDQGINWYVNKKNSILHTDKGAIGSGHAHGPWIGYSSPEYWISKGHKEIKIAFKTVIDSVEYPAPEETQAQKELKELEDQLQKLNEKVAQLKMSINS